MSIHLTKGYSEIRYPLCFFKNRKLELGDTADLQLCLPFFMIDLSLSST